MIIGWIGSQSTFKYLLTIKEVLKRLIAEYNVFVHIVGAKDTLGLGEHEIHADWSEETEVASILKFDVGIMPLIDTPWEQGKCAYKLIQYMGCGIPVVASAVGMNNKVVKHDYSGFLVKSETEWFNYLEKYTIDSNLRKEHGENGREIVENKYCLQKQLHKYLEIFKNSDNDKFN
jgi:glycosyltransferase involved in cell wall biosynthesis